MNIIYRNFHQLKYGPEADFRNFPKPNFSEEWYLGIDGSSTAYGMALYNYDYSDLHLFIFCRDLTENAGTFREVMYDWIRNYLFGIKIQTVTYEKTPEGYRPPTSHAEKVMRETELATKNFVYDRNYLNTRGKEYIFDIYPNSWKSYSVPKSEENLGKVIKELNARAVVESCGLDPDFFLRGFESIPYHHDYDCFEALGVGRYGSHFLVQDDGAVKIYKNFSKIGNHMIVAKRLDPAFGLQAELGFVGRFGAGKTPRICTLNETHSLAENFFGLNDKEFNNILLVPKSDPNTIYIDTAFGFDLRDTRDYIILGTKSAKSDDGELVVKNYGFESLYI